MKAFGRAGEALFDVWSAFGHFPAGLLLGVNLNTAKLAFPFWKAALAGLILGYLWEVFEGGVLEPLGAVRKPENRLNRWVTDPLLVTAGAMLGWLGIAWWE